MGHPNKAIAYVVTVSILPPVLLFFTYTRLSLPWQALIAAFEAYVLSTFTYTFFTDPLRHLPHPPSSSIGLVLGGGLPMLKPPPGEQFLQWARNIPNNGIISWRGFFHVRPFLLLTSPAGLREVLLDKPYDFVKPERARNFLQRILGEGLVTSEGQTHKTHRKAVAPAFSGHHIQELIPTFSQKAQQFTVALAESLGVDPTTAKRTGIVEIGGLATRVTLDIIGLAGLGRDFRSLQNSDDELAKCYEQITDPKGIRYFLANMVFPSWLVSRLPWSENKRFNNATAAIRRTAYNLLNEKRESLKNEPEGHKDILTVLLKSKTQLTDSELIDQLLTFLAAGHETTASALQWSVYLLAQHQEVQTALREEVSRTLSAAYDNGTDREKAIDGNAFLTAVCNETLRLYPTVPNTARRVFRPTTLLGYPLRPGTDVIISQWTINRAPELWGADADEFKPARWMGADNANTGGAQNPLAFLTFLHGPRSCIGQGFARSELRYLLAAIVGRFQWEMAVPGEEVVRAGAVTIKPESGLRVKLTEL